MLSSVRLAVLEAFVTFVLTPLDWNKPEGVMHNREKLSCFRNHAT